MIGQVFVRRRQTYTVIGSEPYIRRDGAIVSVTTLRTNCKTCGVEFACTAGPKDLQEPKRYLTRRCPSCRPRRKWAPPRQKCPHCGQRMPEVNA